jgi:hypothetical protein
MSMMIRSWATLRGERCLATVVAIDGLTYRRGQELIAGNSVFKVTRILQARGDSTMAAWSREIWGRPVRTRNAIVTGFSSAP